METMEKEGRCVNPCKVVARVGRDRACTQSYRNHQKVGNRGESGRATTTSTAEVRTPSPSELPLFFFEPVTRHCLQLETKVTEGFHLRYLGCVHYWRPIGMILPRLL